MESCKGEEGAEMKKCMMKEMKMSEDNECMMCAKEMMDDDDKMMMCDEACAAEMKACEGKKDNKEEMMGCMRGQMAMDTEGKGKCMMCKKKMSMDKGDDDKKMCMEECSAEMKACAGDKESEEDFTRCMRGQMAKEDSDGKCMMCKKKAMEDDEEKEMMSKCKDKCSGEMAPCKDKEGADMKKCMMGEMKKNPDNECMMCAKDMMSDDDKMMMCDEACAAEMKACEGKKDNKEEMMRCMRTQMALDTEGKGKCMMCKKKMSMDKGDDDKKMCMEECSAEMKACAGDKESE